MKFVIPIAPQSKQRPRTGRGKVYTAEKTRRYEANIRKATSHLERLDGQLMLDATFVFKRPKRMSKANKARQPRAGTPDVDNLLKALCDGLQGSIISNDSAFVEMTGRKLYAALDEPACIEIEVTPYDSKKSVVHTRTLGSPKQHILEALAEGASCKEAALMSSVSESTFHRWKKEDHEFAEQVETARLRAEAKIFYEMKEAIEQARDWRGYAWLLERRFPERWGARRQVDMTVSDHRREKNQQEIMDKFNELSIKLQASDSGLIQKAVHNEQP